MNKLDIKSLDLNKKIGEGKESIVYDYGDKVIKILNKKRIIKLILLITYY